MKQARILKIVVASPSDVQAERDMIPAIVDELNKGIADERGVRLEVYRWETDAYPAFHPLGPQGQIDSCLRIEDCDLLIGIFWKRFGTPVHDAQSGTEHEIRLALESCEKMGRPQLMIYFNQAPHEPQSQAEKEQWQQVLDFKQTLSQKVLWWEYNGKDQFRDFVRLHLTRFIRGDYSGRSLDVLLQAYRDYLTRRVSTVRIFGEAETRPLEKVFVELTLTEEYERPTINAQWLGMMDAELRSRRDIFARYDEDRGSGSPEKERKKEKRTLKPDELLRRRTKAVIVGAPGCGKTTLLRYLSLKTLQDGKRFPVFLELKSLSEKAFEEADGNLIELLFAKAIAAPLDFSPAEAERCKVFFLARLKAGDTTIFLDGLDEAAGTKFFNALCRSVNDFMTSAYRHNDLIISTRPYAFQHYFEDLEEMEIAILSPRQVETFLQHYYGGDQYTKQLQQELNRRRELREMARVPFLLGVIAYLYHQQGEIIGARLELYRLLVQQLVTRLDREKNVERFYLPDTDGSLKWHFIKQLAYERLFVDAVENDAERLIITSEAIAEKARQFGRAHQVVNPHLLVADVKATPLLREVGADAYAFAHLTLQEYLAAVALTEQLAPQRAFCQAYFNSSVAEMEVLPMALGLVHKSNDLWIALEQMPDSLTFINIRLRARTLAYTQNIRHENLTKLTYDLIEFITQYKLEETPYWDAIFSSFSVVNEKFLKFIVQAIEILLGNEDNKPRILAVWVLGKIGNECAVNSLLKTLKNDDDSDVRWNSALALGKIGGEHAMSGLLATLEDEDSDVRKNAAMALGWIGDERAIDCLLTALKDQYIAVRKSVIEALGQIGGTQVVEGLLTALEDDDSNLCMLAAEILGKIGDKRAIDGLLAAALNDWYLDVRLSAAHALKLLGDPRAIKELVSATKAKNINIQKNAVEALKIIGEPLVFDVQLDAPYDQHRNYLWRKWFDATDDELADDELQDEDLYVEFFISESENRLHAAYVLEKIRNMRKLDELLSALNDDDSDVRMSAVAALEQVDDERSVVGLLSALRDEDGDVRDLVAAVLDRIGVEKTWNGLLQALSDDNVFVRKKAAQVVGYYTTDKQMLDTLQNVAANDSAEEVRTAACEAAEKYANKLRYFTS